MIDIFFSVSLHLKRVFLTSQSYWLVVKIHFIVFIHWDFVYLHICQGHGFSRVLSKLSALAISGNFVCTVFPLFVIRVGSSLTYLSFTCTMDYQF